MNHLKLLYRLFLLMKDQFGINVFGIFVNILLYFQEFIKYSRLEKNKVFSISYIDFYPFLKDKTHSTPLDPVYFYQDCWAAQKISQIKPKQHFDIGSSAKTIGILSQFIPITMVDIRPVELKLEGLSFVKGSITQLPFDDNSIGSISSLCVVEHIGLGRYGDALDQFGSEKAIAELVRVTESQGLILFSVPIEMENKVYFNGHRAFTRKYIIELFRNCTLQEERYINDKSFDKEFKSSKGFSIGLFMFKKN